MRPKATRIGKVKKVGHHAVAAPSWWACDHPERPADQWTCWRNSCRHCRLHMANTLLHMIGDQPVRDVAVAANDSGNVKRSSSLSQSFKQTCAQVAVEFNDPILAAAVEGRRWDNPKERR